MPVAGTHFDNDEGLGITCTTTGANGQSGIRGNYKFTKRRNTPVYYCRFKLGGTGSQRLWIILTSSTVAPPINDTYHTDTTTLIGLAVRSTDTNFQIVRKNTTAGTPTFSNALDGAGAAIPVAASRTEYRTAGATNHAHELWIYGDNAGARWLVSLDRGTPFDAGSGTYMPQIFNSNIPAVDDTLTIQAVIEGTTATAKTLNYYQHKLVTTR